MRAFEGAYFARELAEARQQGRIGEVARDPLLPIRLYWDIGGALVMDGKKMIGDDLEKGLAQLKTVAESGKAAAAN